MIIIIVSKSSRKYVSNIPEKQEVKELQKTDILVTAHILRKVLLFAYILQYLRSISSLIIIITIIVFLKG